MCSEIDSLDDLFGRESVWQSAEQKQVIWCGRQISLEENKSAFFSLIRDGKQESGGSSKGSISGSISGETDTRGNSSLQGEIGISKEFDNGSKFSGNVYGKGGTDSFGEMQGSFGGEIRAEFPL